MQNQYVGDIGDFGKYGMLRYLFPDVRLGVVWYLVPNEAHKNDGKHIAYLTKADYQKCDSVLFNHLKNLVIGRNRSIERIERLDLFNTNTVFYNLQLSYDGISANCEAGRIKRLTIRREWLDAALNATENCYAVFLDPDNGIEIPSEAKHSKNAPKYAFLDEIRAFTMRPQTVVVYQHLGRNGKHVDQIRMRKEQLKTHVGSEHAIFSLHFKPYSARAYFFITPIKRADEMTLRLKQFIDTEWRRCFECMF